MRKLYEQRSQEAADTQACHDGGPTEAVRQEARHEEGRFHRAALRLGSWPHAGPAVPGRVTSSLTAATRRARVRLERRERSHATVQRGGPPVAIVAGTAGACRGLDARRRGPHARPARGNRRRRERGGAWTTRALSTKLTDTANLVTLANNQFTLPAGSYRIQAYQVFASEVLFEHSVRGRLRNVTDGSTSLVSLNARGHIATGESANLLSLLDGWS
jgi:hypothetical protein